jgi:hypothetical protein
MIGLIKKYLFKRCLEKRMPAREKKIVSLENARTIGIICQIYDEDSYKEIHSLFSKLQSHSRSAWLLGYVDKKEVPFYCLKQLSADFFCKKDLNWYGKPDCKHLTDFTQKDFDILIDFTHQNLPALRYILATSHAKLLVGANKHARHFYDIFIREETELNHQKFLKIVYNYLLKLTGNASN